MGKIFKVTKEFCGIPVGKKLTNVNEQHIAELKAGGLIAEVDEKYVEKLEPTEAELRAKEIEKSAKGKAE